MSVFAAFIERFIQPQQQIDETRRKDSM